MLPQFNSLKAVFKEFPDDATALSHFEAIHWKHGAFCPYCKGQRIMHFSNAKTHKCSECRKKFSIRTGTIFEDTKLGMHIWFAAIWLLLNSPKGIASTQLALDLEITQKSAWFVLHRLRYASRTRSFARPLAGHIEADEAMFGGRESNKPLRKRNPKNVNTVGKTVVLGMVERDGEARAYVIPNLKGKTLKGEVRKNVEPGSTVITDEHNSYFGLAQAYVHERVNHKRNEYARGSIHANSVEGMWSLFKRQYHGTHHWISPEHMNAYLAEMCYRFNRRAMQCSLRVDDLLGRVAGRLIYKALISHGQETAAHA